MAYRRLWQNSVDLVLLLPPPLSSWLPGSAHCSFMPHQYFWVLILPQLFPLLIQHNQAHTLSPLALFLFFPSSFLSWPFTISTVFFYQFLFEFRCGSCSSGLMTFLSSFNLPWSTFDTPSVGLPAAPARRLSSSSLCYFYSGTFLLDFVMQTYIWNKGLTCISLRRDVKVVWHLDMSLGTQVFYVTVYPSHTDQLWVCGFVSVFCLKYLKILQNCFYQGEILMYNKWMTIAIWKCYSLCGNQLQISAYSQRQHLNTEYHWQEVT